MKSNSFFASAICFVLVPAALVIFAGCRPKTAPMAPVKGKVTLNGQPLKTGTIMTMPEAGRGAHGDIGPDGSFELGTFTKNDGALVGVHKVAVVAEAEGGRKGPEESGGTKLLTPDRYANPDMSNLTIEVKAGETNSPTIELTSP